MVIVCCSYSGTELKHQASRRPVSTNRWISFVKGSNLKIRRRHLRIRRSAIQIFESHGLPFQSSNLMVCTSNGRIRGSAMPTIVSDGLHENQKKGRFVNVLLITHATESCSMLLFSHNYIAESAPVRWHRNGELSSITVRATARVRST